MCVGVWGMGGGHAAPCRNDGVQSREGGFPTLPGCTVLKPFGPGLQAMTDAYGVTTHFDIFNKPVNAFWALFQVWSCVYIGGGGPAQGFRVLVRLRTPRVPATSSATAATAPTRRAPARLRSPWRPAPLPRPACSDAGGARDGAGHAALHERC